MKLGLRRDHYKEVQKPLGVLLIKESLDNVYEQIRDAQFYIRECNPEYLTAEKRGELCVVDEAFELVLGMLEGVYI